MTQKIPRPSALARLDLGALNRDRIHRHFQRDLESGLAQRLHEIADARARLPAVLVAAIERAERDPHVTLLWEHAVGALVAAFVYQSTHIAPAREGHVLACFWEYLTLLVAAFRHWRLSDRRPVAVFLADPHAPKPRLILTLTGGQQTPVTGISVAEWAAAQTLRLRIRTQLWAELKKPRHPSAIRTMPFHNRQLWKMKIRDIVTAHVPGLACEEHLAYWTTLPPDAIAVQAVALHSHLSPAALQRRGRDKALTVGKLHLVQILESTDLQVNDQWLIRLPPAGMPVLMFPSVLPSRRERWVLYATLLTWWTNVRTARA